MTTKRDGLDEHLAHVEAVVSAFEQDNPELADAIETIGMSIDEYERLVAEAQGVQVDTASNTAT